MAGINKVILIGNLGADPDVRYTPSGQSVATFNVATNKRFKDKDTGEQKERTEWHRCVVWDKTAEIAKQYLKKGAQVYLEGELQTRKWTDGEGVDRYTTEIRCYKMQMLGQRDGGSRAPHPADDETDQDGMPSRAQQDADDREAPGMPEQDQPPTQEDFEDDIPF